MTSYTSYLRHRSSLSDENIFTRFRNPIFVFVANTFLGYKINHKQYLQAIVTLSTLPVIALDIRQKNKDDPEVGSDLWRLFFWNSPGLLNHLKQ